MTILELCDRCIDFLSSGATKCTENSEENAKLIKELQNLKGWAYPQLELGDITQVVRCRRCKFYKRYKKKGSMKGAPFYACSITKTKRDPDFYCKDGKGT